MTRPVLRVLIDTNVILDVVLDRAPWAIEAAQLLDAVQNGVITGFVASHAVSTIHYVVERETNRVIANTAVSDVLALLDVVSLDRADFQRALALGHKDYEDAVQVAACLKCGAEVLVTRNARDFKGAPVVVRSAAEVVAGLRR